MKSKNDITARFDDTTYKKLKEFSIKNNISVSEIFRAVVEKSEIEIKNVRPKSSIITQAKGNKNLQNTNRVMFYLNKELIQKFNKMKIENNAPYSELARCLIANTDFSKLKLNTINDKEKFNIHIGLDASTHKKLKEFAITNYIAFSEIIRVLVEKSDVKINVRDISKVLSDGARVGKTKKDILLITINNKLYKKLNDMKIENHTSHSEIISYLINNTNLSEMKFETKDKAYSASRQKVLKRKSEPKK